MSEAFSGALDGTRNLNAIPGQERTYIAGEPEGAAMTSPAEVGPKIRETERKEGEVARLPQARQSSSKEGRG